MPGKVYTLADIALTHAKPYKGILGPPARHDKAHETLQLLPLDSDVNRESSVDDVLFRYSGSEESFSESGESNSWFAMDINENQPNTAGRIFSRRHRQNPMAGSIRIPRADQLTEETVFVQQQRLLAEFSSRKKRRVDSTIPVSKPSTFLMNAPPKKANGQTDSPKRKIGQSMPEENFFGARSPSAFSGLNAHNGVDTDSDSNSETRPQKRFRLEDAPPASHSVTEISEHQPQFFAQKPAPPASFTFVWVKRNQKFFQNKIKLILLGYGRVHRIF